MKIAYHLSRVLLGSWFLFSGAWHFFWPWLQPMGSTPEAVAFTKALMASGLFDWVKAIELVTGITMLLNRVIPITVVAIVPLNIVIVYWNLVLDHGVIEYIFAALTVIFNALVAWPWRRNFWPLFVFKGRPDYTLAPGWEDQARMTSA
jgi:uncharacterized membrane protein